VYLAMAPKSNEIYLAYEQAKEDALKTLAEPVPMHIRNAPTRLMKKLGYGKGYKYPHNYPDAEVDQEYMPKNLKKRKYLKGK
jgi:putative ATPase